MIRVLPARRRLSLDAAELRLLQELAAATQAAPVRMGAFLQRHFFTEAAGRALILQPGGAFGYYYLRRDLFEQDDRLAAETRALLDLIVLIARLRRRRLIHVFPVDRPADADMLFVGGLFRSPRRSTAHIILNERGDYTFQPDSIQDEKDEEIYRGVRLDGDLYALVLDQSRGLVDVMPDIRDCLAAPPDPPPPPKPPLWRRHAVALVGLLALLAVLVDAGLWWRYYRPSPTLVESKIHNF